MFQTFWSNARRKKTFSQRVTTARSRQHEIIFIQPRMGKEDKNKLWPLKLFCNSCKTFKRNSNVLENINAAKLLQPVTASDESCCSQSQPRSNVSQKLFHTIQYPCTV